MGKTFKEKILIPNMVSKDHRMHLDPFYDQKTVNLEKTIEKLFPKSMYTLKKKRCFGPKTQKIIPNSCLVF